MLVNTSETKAKKNLLPLKEDCLKVDRVDYAILNFHMESMFRTLVETLKAFLIIYISSCRTHTFLAECICLFAMLTYCKFVVGEGL